MRGSLLPWGGGGPSPPSASNGRRAGEGAAVSRDDHSVGDLRTRWSQRTSSAGTRATTIRSRALPEGGRSTCCAAVRHGRGAIIRTCSLAHSLKFGPARPLAQRMSSLAHLLKFGPFACCCLARRCGPVVAPPLTPSQTLVSITLSNVSPSAVARSLHSSEPDAVVALQSASQSQIMPPARNCLDAHNQV